jgi:aspartate/methionine/tyrosine aminotransferase
MTEAAARGYRHGHPDWANLGQGAPEAGVIPGCTERIESLPLSESDCEYAPVPGLPELREAVARLYNHRYRQGKASQYGPENVAIAPGGRSALTRIATALGRINLGHLLPDYTAYEELLEVFRAFVPIPIAIDESAEFTLSAKRLRQAIVSSGLGAVLLSNPCNPTGRHVRGRELERCVAVSRELGCALLLDEFYAHYVYGSEAVPESVSAAAYVEDVDSDPVIIVDGLTKNWRYPGLRISWTVAPRPVIEAISSAGSFLDGGASHVVQRAALPLLSPECAQREARAIQATFSRKRTMMLERIEAMGMRLHGEPEGAFYCFADLRDLPAPLCDGMEFFRAALEVGVICVPGEFFDVNPGKRRSHIPSRLKSFVRLSFGPEQVQLERGLERLAAMIARAR